MVDSAVSYRSEVGDTVDLIAWRHYGNQIANATEVILEANRGLAEHGAVLPAGTLVILPEVEQPRERESVRLWG